MVWTDGLVLNGSLDVEFGELRCLMSCTGVEALESFMLTHSEKLTLTTLFALDCDLQGRKINFTNSRTLVGVATDRGARYLRPARM